LVEGLPLFASGLELHQVTDPLHGDDLLDPGREIHQKKATQMEVVMTLALKISRDEDGF